MPAYKHNPSKKDNWATRLKKNVKSVLEGPGHSKAGKKYIADVAAKGMKLKKGKVVKTLATQGIEAKLRLAGLTEAEIKSLR